MSTRFDIGVFFKLFDKFSGPANKLSKNANSLANKFGKMGKTFINAGRNLTKYVTLPIIGLGTYAVRNAIKMEKWGIAFETLLGSTEKSAAMMKQLREMTQETPFEFKTLVEGARYLKVMRVEEKALVPIMKKLGDVALGDNEKFQKLAEVYGKVNNMGRLLAKQQISFALAGFNPLAFLAEKTGKSMDFFRAKMRAGRLTIKDVTEALMYATSKGQMFFEGTEKLSKTLYGRLSILRDNIFLTSEGFGQILAPTVEKITIRLTELVKKWDKLPLAQKETITQMLTFAATMGPVLLVLGSLITAIGKLILLEKALAVFGVSLHAALAPLLLIPAVLVAMNEINKIAERERKRKDEEYFGYRKVALSPRRGRYVSGKEPFGYGIKPPAGGMMGYSGLPLMGEGESYTYTGRTPVGQYPGPTGPPTEIVVKVEMDDGLIAKVEKALETRKNLRVKTETNSTLGRYLNIGSGY
jgi:hypothetical protein